MPRKPRLVVPNYPHHVTQRGSRRQKTFFNSEDYRYYLDLLAAAKHNAGLDVWAYCLMPNHVHLVVVPQESNSLARFFQEAHRQYTRRINFRYQWRGHLWQERFHSFVMDEQHLLTAVRYVELNPVRAGLCQTAWQWRWSSAYAHVQDADDSLVSVQPMAQRVSDWAGYLGGEVSDSEQEKMRRHSKNGRPAGSESFISELEERTNLELRPKKPGRKRSRPDT